MRIPLLEAASEQFSRWQIRDIEEVVEQVASATIQHVTPTIEKRASSSSCTPGDNSASCTTPADQSKVQTVAIVLGTVIPLGCAVLVLYFLHRRHLKRQRLEDLNDPHKSLDFGMNGKDFASSGKKGKKGGPEMSHKELSGRGLRGLSMNMDSPYLLPGELHGSRASLRSMSRSTHDENDPYRPVTFVKNDWESMKSPRGPNGSMYSAAGSMQSGAENASLIANARPMSQSFPKRGDSASPSLPVPAATRNPSPPGRKPVPNRKDRSSSGADKPLPTINTSTTNLADFIPSPPPPPPPPKTDSASALPPRTSSKSVSSVTRKDSNPAPPLPALIEPFPDSSPNHADSPYDSPSDALGYYESETPELHAPIPQMNRISIMGLRPLPSDLPEDNPEQRANRIRSFYKEYFDDSRPNPKGGYVDDYDASYLADYAVYDNAMQKPFAQPVGRRAMTPPPGGARGPGFGPGLGPGPHRRHMSTQSGAAMGGRGRAASAPRKRLPPPAALTSLPTPHMLKNDNAIFNALDFAPPVSYRDRQAGRRPDSPLGVPRPYSPAVAAHSPLVGSYDELAAVPSPHLLRKSGTFTGLDFAPPPRFRDRDGGNASDAGSIRSNRSGISSVQQNAIRAGAYRVSRIPTEMVTTKDDISAQLKPRWDMRAGTNVMG